MSYKVRNATLDDIAWLLTQVKKFSDFYGTGKSLYSETAPETLKFLIENHIVFICDKGQAPVGLIVGLLNAHLFNPEIKVLTELLWWVDEEHRNGRAGLMLLNEFVKFGKEQADWITMSLVSNSNLNPKTLGKFGFKAVESSYLLEVN